MYRLTPSFICSLSIIININIIIIVSHIWLCCVYLINPPCILLYSPHNSSLNSILKLIQYHTHYHHHLLCTFLTSKICFIKLFRRKFISTPNITPPWAVPSSISALCSATKSTRDPCPSAATTRTAQSSSLRSLSSSPAIKNKSNSHSLIDQSLCKTKPPFNSHRNLCHGNA